MGHVASMPWARVWLGQARVNPDRLKAECYSISDLYGRTQDRLKRLFKILLSTATYYLKERVMFILLINYLSLFRQTLIR